MMFIKKIITRILPCLFFTVAQCFGGPAHLPDYAKEIAKVGTSIIKEDKLRSILQLELAKFPTEWQKEALTKPIYESKNLRPLLLENLDKLIQDELVLQYGHENNLLLSTEALANEFKKQKDKLSAHALEIMLKEKNLGLALWKQNLEREIQINHILYEIFKSSLDVTQQEIKSYYNKNRDEFSVPEQIRVRQIVTDNPDKASDLYKRILSGENFAKLALEHSQAPDRSQGGDLGYFSRGQFPKVFDTCFDLEKGELSEVIQSEYGFHIFKLVDRRPAQILPIEDVTNRIYQKLFAEKQKIQYQKWIDKRKESVTVEIFENNLKTMTL